SRGRGEGYKRQPVDLTEHSPSAPTETPPPPVDWPAPSPPSTPPMPIDRPKEPVPALPEPPPVERRRQPPAEPPPVHRRQQPPPSGPESAAPQSEPRTQAPAQHARHSRRANRDDTNEPNVPDAGPSRHSHRADNQHDRARAMIGPSAPSSPRANRAAPAPNGGPVPPPPLKQREREVSPAGPARPAVRRPAESPAQPSSRPAPANGERGTNDAATHIGVQTAKTSVEKAVPQRGWRRAVYRLTRINAGLSRDEKYELELHRRIRRIPSGSHQIAVLSLKGGVGKTTLTVALGSVLAQVRGDRILAFDADADSGNLADRAGQHSTSNVADLLARKDLSHYNDVRAHTSVNAVNLEVLAAADYSTASHAFSATDWQNAADTVSRFYSVVLADCGAGLTRGVVAAASGAVIVTSASVDGARQAAVAIDWLRNNGHQELLGRACVVINHVAPGEPNVAITDLVRQFGQYVRPDRVVVLPWDKHIAAGEEIEIRLLDPVYKRRITELAAALSDDFDRGERR
ncbi:AAA family ATPase, partial [Mycobacterium nebraskense]|uniref:MinD/ParA family ATP-binding protein n=1 Tax=Mycobacterium nebraskense TaxID=244292 RepID=UPI0039C9722C